MLSTSASYAAHDDGDIALAVVCLLAAPADSYRALGAVAQRTRLAYCSLASELVPLCAKASPVGVVVANLSDTAGHSTISAVRLVKIAHPHAVVIAFSPLSRFDARLLLDFARDVADVLVRQGVDDLAAAVTDALGSHVLAPNERLLPLVENALGARPDFLRCFVVACLGDDLPNRVGDVVRTLGVSRRTLSSKFLREGLPSPATVLMRLRLLRAVHSLAYERKTVQQAAVQSGFRFASCLRTALRRHHGITPSEARHRSAIRAILSTLFTKNTDSRADSPLHG